jgi:hypothetical protein
MWQLCLPLPVGSLTVLTSPTQLNAHVVGEVSGVSYYWELSDIINNTFLYFTFILLYLSILTLENEAL